MSDVNLAIVTGQVSSTPSSSKSRDGKVRLSFWIVNHDVFYDYATGDVRSQKESILIVLFGKKAEALGSLIKKGDKVEARGRLHNLIFTDEDGKVSTSPSIFADHLKVIDASSGNLKKAK